jgi:predicted permease
VRRDGTGWLHRLLRWWLPRTLRDAHGEEMEAVFRQRLRDRRRRGVPQALGAWGVEAWDLMATGMRLAARRGRTGGGGMQGWVDDLRTALRSLRRSPGFAAFSVGTLALGLAATITFAALLDRVVLRPVDFPEGDRLVMVWRAQGEGRFLMSPDMDTRERVRSVDVFDGVAATSRRERAWSTEAGPRMLATRQIDAALPALAGLPPLLGRYFDDGDLAGEGAKVTLLSEGLWKRAFGSDPGVLGATVRVDGEAYTVVGVAPDALRAPGPGDPDAELWLPLPGGGEEVGLSVYARMREGVTLEQARERVKAMDLSATEAGEEPWETRLMPVGEMATGRLRNPLKVVGVAVGLLFLIACFNVANLLLARGDARARDTAVRAAVGAGRVRLARELLAEGALIAGASSLVGLTLSAGILHAVRALRPDEFRILDTLHLDPLVTGLAVLCAGVTVLAFGVLPLWRRLRTRPGTVLTERGGTSGANSVGLRRVLLVGEVALSFALLAGATQIVTTLREIRSRDPGMAVDELLAVRMRMPTWRFTDEAERDAVLEQIAAEVRRLPGVSGVALAAGAPPTAGIFFGEAEADGQPPPENEEAGAAVFFGNSVTPGYFATVGQTLLQGREFEEEDMRADPTPYILSQSAAAKYFPGGGAIGGRFRLDAESAWHPVIGVVRDIWSTGGANDPGYPQLYVPREPGGGSTLLVRTDGPPALAGAIRPLVGKVDAEIPVVLLQPMTALYKDALARERLVALLLVAFAVTAATLAAVGLYGVVAQLAVRRTREFGIRISLGAQPGSIFRLALRSGLAAVLVGLACGAGLAWAGLRFLETGVAGLADARPLPFLGAALLLAAVTVVAMGVPASRAARIDPTRALRSE